MNVTIYSTSSCGFCHVLYKWLDDNAISYRKIITDIEPGGMEAFLDVCDGSLGVPLTVITQDNGTVTKITGLDRPQFKRLLNI